MSFESFDSIMLIENSAFLPQGPLAEAPENRGPTLDDALQGAAAASGTVAIDRQAIREAMREATALDLWVERASGTAFTALDSHDAGQPAPLRKLSPDEMALLAGGSGSDMNGDDGSNDGSNVEVWGNPFDPFEWPGGPPNDPGDQHPGGSGSPSNEDPHQKTEDAKDTPCVNEVPEGVDKDHLNDLAKYMGTKLIALQDSTGWEWGAFIYRGSDGELYQSDPFTAQHPNDLNGASIFLPTGAHIVGYIHTHPVSLFVDGRVLSQEDRQFINGLGDIGSVTVDTNLLAYVTTKDGASNRYFDNHSTFVYDKSERDATEPGCDL